MRMNALEATKLAYERKEIPMLLLGEDPYACTDRFTPLPKGAKTDLATVIPAGLHKYKLENSFMEHDLLQALYTISDSLLGIWSIACFIFTESYFKKRGKPVLNIDVNQLAAFLKTKIFEHKIMLNNEKINLNGHHYIDGVLGELKRISVNTIENDGPNFLPEELNKKTTS